MNRLWKYNDYVNHLSHENEIVRRWAFSALENCFLNRYTDQVANLINDENEHLVCAALRYLSFHQSVQHAPAILERFKSGQGIISSNCAITLAKMHYEPAMAVMLERFSITEDSETFFGVLEYLGNMRTEECRAALKSAVIQVQDTVVLRPAISNLLHHHNPEDINWVMERLLNSGDSYDSHDIPLQNVLSPLGGGSYFRDLTEFGENGILSKPLETIDSLVSKNAHITIDETLRENLITLLKKRCYQDFTTAVMFDARKTIHARYPQKDNPDGLRELIGQDTMCLHLLDDLSKRDPIWKQVESSNAFGSDIISLIISAYFAVKERSVYVKASSLEAGVDELILALQNSGPNLPKQIQDKIKALSPNSELKASLSKDLMLWGDIWAVKLMGMLGNKEFIPELFRVLRKADSLDYIYSDALSSINALDESADESILIEIKDGELGDWESFAILEYLPYVEAYELALNKWESDSEDGMDSYEQLSSCLRGIGDRRGIKKLQEIYAEENDAGYIGDSLECLSKIHKVDIPELPEIIKKRKERTEIQKTRMKELNELAKNYNAQKKQGTIKSTGKVVAFKRKSPKIGRNEPCPCGSGKKFKKCCLNKK
ncbi:SEC-C metal-binding domain-containing protein [Desulfobacterales bacterium]|nr:SEC-C metal-binding domain-containing protein [Desulfobacterales bacterium]